MKTKPIPKAAILLASLSLATAFITPLALRGQGQVIPVPDRIILQIRELQGLAISPVPMNFDGKDPELVALGSYLVNTGCVSCHTSPTFAAGGDPFAGQQMKVNATNFLAGGAVFGPFASRNITPDTTSGNPANLTFEEFERALRKGEDVGKKHPQMGPLLQVMPWPEFSKLTERDLRAIYEYLRSIPHADPAPK